MGIANRITVHKSSGQAFPLWPPRLSTRQQLITGTQAMALEKTFDAAQAENRLYEAWETSGSFTAGANA